MAVDLSTFIEYDEYLAPHPGIDGVKLRVTQRLSLKRGEIPYYRRGMKYNLFEIGTQTIADVRTELADIDSGVNIDLKSGRVTLANINITVDSSKASAQAQQTAQPGVS